MLIYKSLIIRRKNNTNILQAIPQKRIKERVAIAWTIKLALDNTLSRYITIPSHKSFCNIIRNSHFSLSSGKMHSNFLAVAVLLIIRHSSAWSNWCCIWSYWAIGGYFKPEPSEKRFPRSLVLWRIWCGVRFDLRNIETLCIWMFINFQ